MPCPSPLIDAAALAARLAEGEPTVLLDCSFELTDPDAGERQFAEAHLPGALYVHLDRDLCGPRTGADGRFRGRHPLPSREAFAATLGRLGVAPDTTVVAYDRQGSMYAARVWWMLRWMGHDPVRVLDGGLPAWRATGAALVSGAAAVSAPRAPYPERAALASMVEADALARRLGELRLIDARAVERFRGEIEPLDAVAGHIPGARNRPFKDNLAADGRFLDADALRAAWAPLLAGHAADAVVHQCGSGVTACHNLLAVAAAGLGEGVLYPGSWSEWSADPARPVARG